MPVPFSTPQANRLHIGIFGRRNAGKSSLINRITGQDLAVVSEIKGTTTDPVYKSMELLPLGPVVFIDTPGYDDEGELGELRIRKTRQVLNKVDLALLVVAGEMTAEDREIEALIKSKRIPYAIVANKCDLAETTPEKVEDTPVICVSALDGTGIQELKELLGKLIPEIPERPLVADLVKPGEVMVLVAPIDSAAPKGRLILPQQQVLRDALEHGILSVVVRETELAAALSRLENKVALVVTDSQAFEYVAKIVPTEIRLTSFSLLMARYKGNLAQAAASAAVLKNIKPGDKLLIAEGCTHHRQCADIGTVKLPAWIRKYASAEDIAFEYVSGGEFPEDLSEYKAVIHCGGCMLNEREMQYRARCAADQQVPFINYGMAIAQMTGIFDRCKWLL